MKQIFQRFRQYFSSLLNKGGDGCWHFLKIKAIQHFVSKRMASHLNQEGQDFLKGQFPLAGKIFSRSAAKILRVLRHIPNYGVQCTFNIFRIVFHQQASSKMLSRRLVRFFYICQVLFLKFRKKKALCITFSVTQRTFLLTK